MDALSDPVVGQVCMAQFSEDERWYRAKILSLGSEEEKDKIEVYYVDYGNTELVPKEHIRALHREFVQLPVQTVRCSISDIKPVSAAWGAG